MKMENKNLSYILFGIGMYIIFLVIAYGLAYFPIHWFAPKIPDSHAMIISSVIATITMLTLIPDMKVLFPILYKKIFSKK